jgi:hypothetical protein
VVDLDWRKRVSTVTLEPMTSPILDRPEDLARARERLEYHRAVLEQNGIQSVGDLGTLALSGAVSAEAGILFPASPRGSGITNLHLPEVTVGRRPLGVYLPTAGALGTLTPAFVEAGIPTGARRIGAAASVATLPRLVRGRIAGLGTVPLDTAYFVAQTVTFADNTVVVLARPHRYLTFIAERIIVGKGVTFTYEQPIPQSTVLSWSPEDRPPPRGKAPTPDGLWGVTGDPGENGLDGGDGWAGVDGPELELWTLELDGSPVFALQGQDGSAGGRGRDGGHGGAGSDGRAETYDWLGFCSSGAGWGGDGGAGGNGGNGGTGGVGGHGGRLTLYAPATTLLRYTAGGFTVSTQRGRGGAGGQPGQPGNGGGKGWLGPRPKNCWMSEERHDGNPGAPGHAGSVGAPGRERGEYGTPGSSSDRTTRRCDSSRSRRRSSGGSSLHQH